VCTQNTACQQQQRGTDGHDPIGRPTRSCHRGGQGGAKRDERRGLTQRIITTGMIAGKGWQVGIEA
jgi:hypothetical protein